MNFDATLKDLVRRTQGNTDCDTFRATTKSNHPFALEYCAPTAIHDEPPRPGEAQRDQPVASPRRDGGAAQLPVAARLFADAGAGARRRSRGGLRGLNGKRELFRDDLIGLPGGLFGPASLQRRGPIVVGLDPRLEVVLVHLLYFSACGHQRAGDFVRRRRRGPTRPAGARQRFTNHSGGSSLALR